MMRLLRKYWRSLLVTLTLLVVASCSAAGYYYTRHTQREALLRNASYSYEQLVQTLAQTPSKLPLEKITTFVEQYANTPYPALLQLQLAQQRVSQNKPEEAFQFLQAAAKSATDPDIRCFAIQRGARVLSAMGKTQEALQLLNEIHETVYLASTEEIKGDILLASGDKEKALHAYRKAEQSEPELAAIKPLLQMKLNDLKYLEKPEPVA